MFPVEKCIILPVRESSGEAEKMDEAPNAEAKTKIPEIESQLIA